MSKENHQDPVSKGSEFPEIKPVQVDSNVDVPPIVTYPEFLAPAPAPPAPVNVHNLISGLYLAGGVAATIYGASKFYFQPMYDSLTSARIDLHATALENLTTFNEKLSTLVPNQKKAPQNSNSKRRHSNVTDATDDEDITQDDDNISETSSSANSSDPTELFHVDIGTQTSPSPSVISPEDGEELDNSPEAKLEKISNHLSTLVASNSDGTDNELMFELESLSTYLDSLSYDRFATGMMGDFYGPYAAFPGAIGPHNKDDPIAKVRAEIRSVKGVFLNTKNFPAGGLR